MAALILRPLADASGTGWASVPLGSTRFDKVDEAVADEDTTYMSSASLAGSPALQVFSFGAVPQNMRVSKITVFCRAMPAGSGTGYIKPKVSGVDHASYTALSYSAGVWIETSWEYAANPATGMAWTREEVNALAAGLLGYTSNNKVPVKVTQFCVTVAYERAGMANGADAGKVDGAVPGCVNGVAGF